MCRNCINRFCMHAGNFSHCPETFQSVLKISRLSGNFWCLLNLRLHFMANLVNRRKNFPDVQKFSGRQCWHTDKVFGTLANRSPIFRSIDQYYLKWSPSGYHLGTLPDRLGTLLDHLVTSINHSRTLSDHLGTLLDHLETLPDYLGTLPLVRKWSSSGQQVVIKKSASGQQVVSKESASGK